MAASVGLTLHRLICRDLRECELATIYVSRRVEGATAISLQTGHNDQDCLGCVRHTGDHVRSTIAHTGELIEISHREVVGFRAP
jgi:hypothetical protein